MTDGSLVMLPTTSLSNMTVSGLNDVGQVSGYGQSADGSEHGFIWSASAGLMDLGDLGGGNTQPHTGINASGQVVGQSNDVDGNAHAFVWSSANGMIDLTPAASYAYAMGINDSGQVVGTFNDDAGAHTFSWTATGGLVIVPDLGVGPHGSSFYVNASGQIAEMDWNQRASRSRTLSRGPRRTASSISAGAAQLVPSATTT